MSFVESSFILSTKNLTSAPATKAFPAPSRTIVSTSSLEIANQLLNDAISTGDDLDRGLNLELAQLNTIFESKDALEGLSALIEGRRPKYHNL